MVTWLMRSAAGVATCAALAAPLAAEAAASLYAIGADDNGVGRVLTSIVPTKAGVALGDGSTAFNGGLAYLASSDRFYAIRNDSLGQSSLTSFTAAAPNTFSTPLALGTGYLGGLAADTADSRLYAIASDSLGASTLYRVDATNGATALGALGSGFYGGLSYDAFDRKLYAIGADDSGLQRRLSRIELGTGGAPTVTTLFDLGDGSLSFQSGLAYDSAQQRFVTIGSTGFGDSELFSFTVASASSLTGLGVALAPGFVNAGLSFGPELGGSGGGGGGGGGNPIPAVPEPSTVLLWCGGVLMLFVWARRRECAARR